MTGDSHPALHPGIDHHLSEPHGEHFVPNGWEDVDLGVCPCGELVRWDYATARWIKDRTLRLFVLPADQAEVVAAAVVLSPGATPQLVDDLQRQLTLNESVADDGNVLIAGILYDRETLEESTTP